MATLYIDNATTVADLKRQFRNAAGGTLRVYDGGSTAPTDTLLTSLRTTPGELMFPMSCTVGEFEKSMREVRSLKVKVFTADNWVKVLDGIALGKVAELPKQATREKMRQYVSSPSDLNKTGNNTAYSQPMPEQPSLATPPSLFASMVEADIQKWLASSVRLFFNERDMQVDLAVWLAQTAHYNEVRTEYYIPNEELKPGYVWDSEMRIDIALRKFDEWLIIELKYKTDEISEIISRFGEPLDGKHLIVKHQGAQNLSMYDFWKDVRRIEIVKQRFNSVVGGIALFLTNDKYYPKGPKEGVSCSKFSMAEGTHGTDKSWQGTSDTDNPNFKTQQPYTLHWETASIGDYGFRYILLHI